MNTNSLISKDRLTSVLPKGSDEDEIDISNLLYSLWRGKWIILACGLIATMLGAYHAFNNTRPVYTASALVALNTREEKAVSNLESVVSGLSTDWMSINTELEILKSRTIGARLVDRLNLDEDPRFNSSLRAPADPGLRSTLRESLMWIVGAEPVERVERDPQSIRDDVITKALSPLSVSNDGDSYVFKIAATTGSPALSAQLANTLAQLYIEDQLQLKFDATKQAANWLSDRVAELRAQLEASEQKAKEFDSSIELVSDEGLAAVNRQLKDMRERYDASKLTAERLDDRVRELEAAFASGDREALIGIANDTTLRRLAGTITDSRSDAFDARVEQLVARARTEADRARSQSATLAASVEELEAQVEQQSSDLVTLQQLQRETEANRLIYESFLVRLREITVQQGIQQADARILSEAVIPKFPSAPKKSRIVMMSLILGVALGAALVLLREMRRQGFRTARELEDRTGVPVLGQIATMPIRQRGKLVPYILENPTSVTAEATRNLRTSLQLSNVDQPPQVILSTSSLPGEGKSTTSIMLAHQIAALGNRVLVLEGDLRRPVMDQYFDINRHQPGVSAVLIGETPWNEAVVYDEKLGIDILNGDRPKASAADLFSSEKFRALLSELRQSYDYIIIDSPPALVVPDSRVIAPLVDAILFSVRWNRTTRTQVAEGLAVFGSIGIRVTGLVLTNVNQKAMRRYGYDKAYGGYGYGSNAYYRK
ncbi:GumC family protein [Tropicimonas isoalkanivorans]|uniref:non-specific protein-tyrosine kinase n=1 Tax=Tropicimonas isoalkanivorans TaxID=441112 RepID=A0A1I1ELL6_9RHOB|nr:polysaccharide biosynthesis tyrosine autokinase [Tropicimonas isoalkanivorans]SFB86378.1 capsular exopolysaccharide family [Tropicimonas isoalkanivorans]